MVKLVLIVLALSIASPAMADWSYVRRQQEVGNQIARENNATLERQAAQRAELQRRAAEARANQGSDSGYIYGTVNNKPFHGYRNGTQTNVQVGN